MVVNGDERTHNPKLNVIRTNYLKYFSYTTRSHDEYATANLIDEITPKSKSKHRKCLGSFILAADPTNLTSFINRRILAVT